MNHLENSMVIDGITPAEYNADSTAEPIYCGDCGNEIEEGSRPLVENGAGIFCDVSCNARALYKATETASGKAALMRFVAALWLLSDEDVLARAPQLAWDRFAMDKVYVPGYLGLANRTACIKNLREDAMTLLKTFEIEGAVEWSRIATDMAAELSERLGKRVK